MKLLFTSELGYWLKLYLESRTGISIRVAFTNDYHELVFKQGELMLTLKILKDNNLALCTSLLKFSNDELKAFLPKSEIEEIFIISEVKDRALISFEGQNEIFINYDLIFSIVAILNRYEEYYNEVTDKHGRYLLANSMLSKDNIYKKPVVDQLVYFIRELLEFRGFELVSEQFTYSISCDVDNIHRYKEVFFFRKALTLMKDLVLAPAFPFKYFLNSQNFAEKFDRHQTFDFMLIMADKYGFKYTFNFIVCNTSLRYDYRYKLGREFSKLIRLILSKNHKIGLHFSYNALCDNTTSNELLKFERICQEFDTFFNSWRFHYLRFSVPKVLNLCFKGFYDTSFTFFESGGFRCGTCHAFTPFNLESNSIADFMISPLIVMEGSLLGYSNMSDEEFEREIYFLVKQCRLVNGNFSLLWHNSDLGNREKVLFEKTLKLLSSEA